MLIRRGGCSTVHEAGLAACPGRGRCPACGRRRVPAAEASARSACLDYGVAHCGGCGFAVGACACEHSDNPERVAAAERAFGLRP